MALQIKINNGSGGGAVDYTRYVEDGTLKVEDSINVPNICDFTMSNIDNLFVVPVRNAYVSIFSTKESKYLFTGFITSVPEITHLGSAGNAKSALFQRQRYKVQATSDEYILNIKSVPFVPAFVNQTMGQILTNLANVLYSGFFDTSKVQAGDLIPFFQYDPTQKWSDLAKTFADAARFYYTVVNKQIIFEPYSATSLGVSYDEKQSQGTFDPFSLKTSVLTVPPVNDAIVIGDVEPQEVHDDFFIGDGVTSNFALRHSMFHGSSQLLLQEDWTGASFSNAWLETDPQNAISLGSGALVVQMSASGALGTEYVIGQNGVELGGHLDLQHGEFFFTGLCQGIIGGVYSSSPPTQASCILGFQVSSAQNLLQWSQGFDNAVWAYVGVTRPSGPTIVAPDGSSSAFALTASGANCLADQLYPLGAGKTYTFSVWLKVPSGTKTIAILINDSLGSGPGTQVTCNLTTSWQRFSVTRTIGTPLGDAGVVIGGNSSWTAGEVDVWGAQLELSNTVNPYIPTTVGPSVTVVVTSSGASGLQIKPMLNGAELPGAIASPVIVKIGHHYFIETFVTARRWSRYDQIYRTLAGTPFGDTLLPAQAETTFVIWDIDLLHPETPVPTKYYTTASLPSFGLYAPVNAIRLNLTLNYTLINQPPQGLLTVQSLYGPTGLNLPTKIPGPEEPYRLGSGFGQQVATVVSSQGTGSSQGTSPDALQFYAGSLSNMNTWVGGTIPAVGARIRLRSWEAGKALARVRDPVSVAKEAAVVGDDGLRTGVFADLNPLPRTSDEAELAAKATILDRESTQYDGSYTVYDYFRDKNQDFPRSGRYINVNSPARGISGAQFLVRSVNVSVETLSDEVIVSTIEFGQDLFVEKLLKRFLPSPTNILDPKDAAITPPGQTLAQLGTYYATDLLDVTVSRIGVGQNLLQWSQETENSIWTKVQLTASGSDAVVAPDGTLTADALFATAGATDANLVQFPIPVVTGHTYTFSVWLKIPVGTRIFPLVIKDDLSGAFSVTNATLTTAWQRFSVTRTIGPLGSTPAVVVGGIGTWVSGEIDVWGAQLEEASFPGPYLPSAGAPVLNGPNQVWVDLGAVPVTGAEIRRVDNGWGISPNGLVQKVTSRFVVLLRTQFEQIWYVRQVNGPAISRFSRVIRVVYPLVPSPPLVQFTDVSDFQLPRVQFNFNGDMRNIFGLEVRDSDGVTVLLQRPLFSVGDLLYTFDNTTRRVNQQTFFVYFFNLQWEYSPPLVFTLQCAALPTGGKNYLINPGFELNNVGTVARQNYPINASMTDGWFIRSQSTGMQAILDNSASFPRSGVLCLEISALGTAGVTIPANTVIECRVGSTPPIPVRGGQVVYFGGYCRLDRNQAAPAGVATQARIGILIFDSTGALLSEQVSGPDFATFDFAYHFNSGAFTLPLTAATVILELCNFVNNTNGSPTAIPNAGTVIDARFDDVFLIEQENLDQVPNGTRAAWDTGTQKTNAVDANGNLLLKNIFGSQGTTSSPATTSTTYVNVPEMTRTITTKGNPVLIVFSGAVTPNNGGNGNVAIFRDGSQISPDFTVEQVNGGTLLVVFASSLSYIDTPAAGSHTWDVRWKVAGAAQSLTALGTGRTLQVVELG